jgi:hypothetical protein
VPLSINIGTGVGRYYLDKLIKEEQKQEGRKRKFISLKLEQDMKEKKMSTSRHSPRFHKLLWLLIIIIPLDENILEIALQKEAADIVTRKATEERKRVVE